MYTHLEITKGNLLQESHGKKFQLWEYKGVEYILCLIDFKIMTREYDEIISKTLDLNPIF